MAQKLNLKLEKLRPEFADWSQAATEKLRQHHRAFSQATTFSQATAEKLRSTIIERSIIEAQIGVSYED